MVKLPRSLIREMEECLNKGEVCELALVGGGYLAKYDRPEQRADIDLPFPLSVPSGPAEIRVQRLIAPAAVGVGPKWENLADFRFEFEGQWWLRGLKGGMAPKGAG